MTEEERLNYISATMKALTKSLTDMNKMIKEIGDPKTISKDELAEKLAHPNSQKILKKAAIHTDTLLSLIEEK